MTEIEVEQKITELQDALVFWKQQLKLLDGQGAIIILVSESEAINRYTVECLPELKKEKRYEIMVIVSNEEEVLQYVKNNLHMEAEYMSCSKQMIENFCHVQTLTNFFRDIYINISDKIDDADSFLLEGYSNLTKKDIVAQVFLQLSHTPIEKELLEDAGNRELVCKINWKEQREWIPADKYMYSTHQEFLKTKLRLLEEENKISPKNKIVLYGATQTAVECAKILSNYTEIVIADRNFQKAGTDKEGLLIDTPESILLSYNPDIRILITIYQFKSVCEHLWYLGYKLGEQVFIVNYKVSWVDKPIEPLLEEIEQRVLQGADAYQRLRNQYPSQRILLSPWAASGDIYIDGLYLKDYVLKNNLKDYIVTVSTVGAKKVADLFDIDTVLISEEDSFGILDFARAVGFEKINVYNINVTVKEGQRALNLHGIVDFNTFHQRLVFQEKNRQTVPEIKQYSADEWFEKFNLKKGKTILLSPYSNTLGNIPEEICIGLAERLKKKGYDVCTNISGKEVSVPGTVGIFIPYNQVLDFLDKAGGFIGMRSGLCDVVSSTTSKMAILYRTYSCNKRSVYEYFSLQKMGLKEENILELIYENESTESIIEKIDSFYVACNE